jgi:hypothetical protein
MAIAGGLLVIAGVLIGWASIFMALLAATWYERWQSMLSKEDDEDLEVEVRHEELLRSADRCGDRLEKVMVAWQERWLSALAERSPEAGVQPTEGARTVRRRAAPAVQPAATDGPAPPAPARRRPGAGKGKPPYDGSPYPVDQETAAALDQAAPSGE